MPLEITATPADRGSDGIAETAYLADDGRGALLRFPVPALAAVVRQRYSAIDDSAALRSFSGLGGGGIIGLGEAYVPRVLNHDGNIRHPLAEQPSARALHRRSGRAQFGDDGVQRDQDQTRGHTHEAGQHHDGEVDLVHGAFDLLAQREGVQELVKPCQNQRCAEHYKHGFTPVAPARLYLSSAAFLNDATPRNLGVIEGERKRRSRGYDEDQAILQLIAGFGVSLLFIATTVLVLGTW